MKLEEAFLKAQTFLTQPPISAEWSSVKPLVVLPSGDDWIVTCDYSSRGQAKERAFVLVAANGDIKGFGKLQWGD